MGKDQGGDFICLLFFFKTVAKGVEMVEVKGLQLLGAVLDYLLSFICKKAASEISEDDLW